MIYAMMTITICILIIVILYLNGQQDMWRGLYTDRKRLYDTQSKLVDELRSKIDSKDLEIVRLKQELRHERQMQQFWRARCTDQWLNGKQFGTDGIFGDSNEATKNDDATNKIKIVSIEEEPVPKRSAELFDYEKEEKIKFDKSDLSDIYSLNIAEPAWELDGTEENSEEKPDEAD